MLLLPLLFGCATPIWGVWMFTLALSPATGEECVTSISHNFAGAHEPVTAAADETWVSESTEEFSSQVFFGRLEEMGQSSVLILGNSALPGERKDDGTSMYAWESFDKGTDQVSHASGYAFSASYADESALRIAGTFNNDTFVGKYSTESTSLDQWNESDTWSDEAALTLGDRGSIPSAPYLVLTDGAGVETPVVNIRQSYDCDSAGCTLSAETACGYSYELTGQATDFEADDRWVRDAGQPAGGT